MPQNFPPVRPSFYFSPDLSWDELGSTIAEALSSVLEFLVKVFGFICSGFSDDALTVLSWNFFHP